MKPSIDDKVCSLRNKKVLLLRLESRVHKENRHPINCRPPYILKYIESLLKKENDILVNILDQCITSLSFFEVDRHISQWRPDVVVFDVLTTNLEDSVELCVRMKQNDTCGDILTFGVGQEVSADIESFRKKYEQFDMLFAGESEIEVVSVVKQLKSLVTLDEIRHAYEKRSLQNKIWELDGLDELPFPHYDMRAMQKYNFVYPLQIARKLMWGHVLTSRGCHHQCIFCSQTMKESYGTRLRLRSALNIVDEMEHLQECGVNIIAFDDENFTTSRAHVRGVCAEITRRKLKIKWIIHARVDDVDDELLKLMRESGCVLIRFGIETGNRRVLSLLKKTRDEDGWFDKSKKAVKQAQSHGILVVCLFMVGCPTETREEMQESIDFAKVLSPDIIQVAYFTPFPGSRAHAMFKEHMDDVDAKDLYHYNRPKLNLSNMRDAELENAQRIFYRQFLLRPSFIVRHFARNALFYFMNHKIFFRLFRVGINV